MSSFTLRDADISDFPLIEKISEANQSFKSQAYWDQCKKRLSENEVSILMAVGTQEEEARAFGYGLLNWHPKYRAYQQQNIPEIQDLNVIPEKRGQGIGRALIALCESRALEKGCTQAGISFGLTREYGTAQRLYISLGYRPDGFGVTYDREPVAHAQMRPVDDDLCLMLVKDLC